jgi:hypothetical protein
MASKDWKELVDKINASFLNEVSHTWKQCRNKITKMRKKYREEHETCNATCAPPSSWTWYEKLHSILGGTLKMTSAVGGIDQGSHLPHPRVVNLDDHPNSILKTQPFENLECQTPIFVDSNDHVTPNHTSNQTSIIVPPKTRACNLPGTKSKPNKKVTSKKRVCLGSLFSL